MKARQSIQLALASALLPFVIGCGGASPAPTATSEAATSGRLFVTSYNNALAAPQTAGLIDLFDESFLDGGYTKPQLQENLQQDNANQVIYAAQLPLDSVYPALAITDAVFSACDDVSGVCLMTASYSNAAPDGTRATVAVPVRYKDGKFRMYGDQKPV